jgi:hypothetical protein
MLIYSNGCSHTAGHNIDWLRSWPHIVMRGIIGENKYEINPHKKSKKNENFLYNEAVQGAGNDYIFHQSLESLTELIQNNNIPDYVFIQWSGPNRRQHCLPDGEIVNVNLFKNVEYNVKFEPMGSTHTIHYMFVMQEFLKNNNINYCFLNFMSLDESIKKLNIYNEIDLEKFLYIEYDNDILFNGILSHIKKEQMTFDLGGHANEKGNFTIGNELLKKLKFKELNYNKLC